MASTSTPSADRKKDTELTPELRSAIVAAYQAGDTPQTQIAKQFGVHRNTVFKTIKRWREQNTNISRPRSGRPLKYDDRTRRLMARNAQRNRLSSKSKKRNIKSKGPLSREKKVTTELEGENLNKGTKLKKTSKR